ncbi:MAG: phenylalanine--tRNA ligase subunit beta, partial [Pseudomonadota bacterium]|nr:phenylalanine--tRNA ligase subunit beta [Pseudomonadota bacterium]
MKFTLSWLKTHLDTEASLETICDMLTRIGLEVDGVEDPGKDFVSFVVGHVTACEPHPNADKLRLCTVETGHDHMRVVCGAPNARAGMKGVFAREGSFISGLGVTLKKTLVRGVESAGMLLSMREMGLSDEHEGIIELPDDAPIGAPVAEIMGLNDPVIEIGLTPNRADCAGVRGIARDLAAAGLGQLRPLDLDPVTGRFKNPVAVTIAQDARNACPLFVGRAIRGVKNGISPKWMQDRLRAVGLRPINALVDITNYVSLDLVRPLHVFDIDKLKGDITVRMSKKGETIDALDNKSYTLDADMTAITDPSGVLALGGVIGGEKTSSDEDTTNVFVECALFDPVGIAKTGRKLQILTDSRYRFERGVDPVFTREGIEHVTRLILQICGGEPGEIVVAGGVPDWKRFITFDPALVKSLGGVDVDRGEQRRILIALGFDIREEAGGHWQVAPPSWRADVEGAPDLVEEVLRIHGYDAIPVLSLPRPDMSAHDIVAPALKRAIDARRFLAARGMNEVVTWSFMSLEHAAMFGDVPEDLRIVNPLSTELDVMRPSVLPNLIGAMARNAARGFADGAIFEVGPVYRGSDDAGQLRVAAGLRTGQTGPRHWAENPRAVDAFDAKADALALLEALGVPVDKLQVSASAPGWYHPGRSGCLKLGPRTVLAQFGEIHPCAAEMLDLKGPAAGFEVFLDA